jgi:hypothetical protein
MRTIVSPLVSLFVLALLAACNPVSSSSPSPVSHRSSAPASAARSWSAPASVRQSSSGSGASSPQSHFLPLAVGTTWPYRKSVIKDVHAWEAYSVVGNDTVQFGWGTSTGIQPGRSTETFKVAGLALLLAPVL